MANMERPSTSKPIRIVRARPNHAEDLVRIRRAAKLARYHRTQTAQIARMKASFEHTPENKAIISMRRKLQNQDQTANELIFAATVNGSIAGYTSVQTTSNKPLVGALYVDPKHQGEGLGKLLLSTALDWHQHNKNVYLFVEDINTRAIEFYKQHGFVFTGNQQALKASPGRCNLEMVRTAPQLQ